jgi:hypothetical protein
VSDGAAVHEAELAVLGTDDHSQLEVTP